MNDPWRDRLSDYLDTEMSESDRQACQRHLASCQACRGLLGDLERIRRWAEAHRPHEPAADPWPEIRRRIEGLPRSSGSVANLGRPSAMPWLARAAAGIALLGGLLLMGWIADRSPSAPDPLAIEADWSGAISRLEERLESSKDPLDPDLQRDLQRSLTMLDAFAAEVLLEIREQPDNQLRREFLTRALRMKLEILRDVVSRAMNKSA